MKIACLSGKGGAGKTFVAVNLAVTCGNCTYIDCDVEEPNGRLFLKPTDLKSERVYKILPDFDKNKCIGCRKCVDFCKFNALFYIKDAPMVFSDICHSCGGCEIICEKDAVLQTKYPVGNVEVGMHGELKVVTGILDTGEGSGIPVIKKALSHATQTSVIDCPPGSACSVMESIECSDFCVIVCEPTAFGFHNMKMVFELATLLDKPCGFIINKEYQKYPPLEQFITENNLEILARIPYDKDVAKCLSSGEIAVEVFPEIKHYFSDLLCRIGEVL